MALENTLDLLYITNMFKITYSFKYININIHRHTEKPGISDIYKNV